MKIEWIMISEDARATNVPGGGVVLQRKGAMCYVPHARVIAVSKADAKGHVAELYSMLKGMMDGEYEIVGELVICDRS